MAFGQYSGGIGAIAGGIAGGIIGYFVPAIGVYNGATLGASLGGMAGGIAGSVFWPEKIDINHPLPPKPHENRVQVSTYGNSIPIVYESARVAGNIIYMSDVVETVERTRHRQDGVRYYEMVKTYTATFAIAFSEGEVVGLSRIWVNGKIFADYRDPAGPYYPTGDIGLASANLSTTIARAAAFYSVYLGTEVQTADSALSALLTAAETPTYRGIFYIVFRDFPVGEFSGVPTIEVEIDVPMASDVCSDTFDGTEAGLDTDFWDGTLSNWNRVNGVGTLIPTAAFIQGDIYTYFEFIGEFDFTLDWSIENITDDATDGGFLDLNPRDSGTFLGILWGNYQDAPSNAIGVQYYCTGTADDSYGVVDTTDRSGKFRVVRLADNSIIGYYWNSSLSRWEWNGDTNGKLLSDGYSSPSFIYLDALVNTGHLSTPVTITIDNFIVTSGCDNTQPRSS